MMTEYQVQQFSRRRSRRSPSFKQIILIGIVALLIGTLHIFVLDPLHPSPYRPLMAMVIAGMLMLMTGWQIGLISPRKLLMLFFWTGFATISLVSALLKGDSIVAELWQMFGIPAVIFTAFPMLTGRHGNIVILFGMLIGFAPYMIVSVLQHPLEYPYKGIMDNPNAFGMVAAMLLAVCYSLLRGVLNEAGSKQYFRVGSLVLLIFGLHALILASYSRTCFVVGGMLFLIFIWSLAKESSRHRKALMVASVVFLTLGSGILFILSISPDTGSSLFVGLFGKNAMKAANEDLLSGRSYVWEMIWKNRQLFGEGVEAMWNKYTFMPHNTYLWILGGKGPLALIFYLGTQLMGLYLSLRLVNRKIKDDGYVIGPFMVIVSYAIMGLTESVISVLGDGIQMSYLLMMGVLIHSYDPQCSGGANEDTIHARS